MSNKDQLIKKAIDHKQLVSDVVDGLINLEYYQKKLKETLSSSSFRTVYEERLNRVKLILERPEYQEYINRQPNLKELQTILNEEA